MATQPTAHTPGPWANNGIDLIDGGPQFGAHLFTTQVGEPISDDEMYANARLISKAPDLLKALVRQVGACFDPECPMCVEHQALIDAICGTQVQA
jgi:hypothetical protein